MALLFWEGFDSYSNLSDLTTARPNILPTWYAYGAPNFPPSFSTTAGRFGTCAIGQMGVSRAGSGLIYTGDISTSSTEIYTGRGVYLSGDSEFMKVMGNTNDGSNNGGYLPDHWDVYLQAPSGYIRAFNGQGTTLGTSTVPIVFNTWNFVEMHVKMSTNNSTNDGIVRVWLNNQLIISNTSCITKYVNTTTYYMGVNLFCEWNGAGTCLTDDIYISDTNGSAPWNGRLGDSRIVSIRMNADAGPNDGNVSTGNTNHYTVIDEIPFSSSDYLTLDSTLPNTGEMFAHTALPGKPGGILAAAVILSGGKTDAGNAAFKMAIKTGANTYNSNTQYLSTTNTYYRYEWVTSPNTGNQWAVSEWDAANVGVYVV